uniref:DUF721 domain-containing protein n=1 Tax=Candidatus Kentrum sp. FW TaxID=2126338 RepID=A0A450S7I8_9GAMM|nr:MAG: hypothetical protein BECKFW1821A_GA0114235_10091 [Candidatus Kentron sp. FW]VFJ47838.1 MAG: hypothetical protein BECKFW1821B_GA0114236_100329 [Candidatus Kentron sp. FW]
MTKFAIPSVMERLNHPGNPLYGLVAQAKFLDAADKTLAKRLGLPFSRHCRLAKISFDTIVLQVDSAVWYSKLRFLGPDIVSFFQTEYGMPTITKVRIYVNPVASQRDKPMEKRPAMSPDIAGLLYNVAKATENQPLRQAWLRLAGNAF